MTFVLLKKLLYVLAQSKEEERIF